MRTRTPGPRPVCANNCLLLRFGTRIGIEIGIEIAAVGGFGGRQLGLRFGFQALGFLMVGDTWRNYKLY